MQRQWSSLLPTPDLPITRTHTPQCFTHSPWAHIWQLRDPRELNSHTLQGGKKCPPTPGGHCPGPQAFLFNLEGPGRGEGGGSLVEWAAVTLQHGRLILTCLVPSLASPVHHRPSSGGPIPPPLDLHRVLFLQGPSFLGVLWSQTCSYLHFRGSSEPPSYPTREDVGFRPRRYSLR